MKIGDFEGYVFSENKRIFIKWFLPILLFMTACISLYFLYTGIRLVGNKGIHILVSALFGAQSILMYIGRQKILNYINIKYVCTTDTVSNPKKTNRSIVDMQMPLFISRITIAGNAKIPWTEHFYLISNKPLMYVSNYEENGLKVVLTLEKKDVVILPIKKETRTWLESFVKRLPIPQYPHVAYFQGQTNY